MHQQLRITASVIGFGAQRTITKQQYPIGFGFSQYHSTPRSSRSEEIAIQQKNGIFQPQCR